MLKKFKKKPLAVCIALVMVLTLAACGGNGNGGGNGGTTPTGDAPIEFIINHVVALDDPLHLAWEYFAEILEERSDGRIAVTIFGNRILSNSCLESAESVRQGIAHMTSNPPSAVAALGDTAGLRIFDFPYMFENLDELHIFLDSDVFREISAQHEAATGTRALPGFSIGWVNVMANSPMDSLTDLEGLRIRTMPSDIQMAVMASVGSSPTPISFGELFTAAQQGVVDGLITSTSLMVSERFYEVCSHMLNWQILANSHVPHVNVEWYNALPADLQEIFDEAYRDFVAYARDLLARHEQYSLAILAERGVTIHNLTPAFREEIRAATQSVFDDFGHEVGPGVIDAVKALLGRE